MGGRRPAEQPSRRALAGLQWEQIDGRRELDLGCVVAATARSRGYPTEASRAVVDAAFAAGYERITAMTGFDNGPALRVLQKLGFSQQGETTFEGGRYAFFVSVQPLPTCSEALAPGGSPPSEHGTCRSGKTPLKVPRRPPRFRSVIEGAGRR